MPVAVIPIREEYLISPSTSSIEGDPSYCNTWRGFLVNPRDSPGRHLESSFWHYANAKSPQKLYRLARHLTFLGVGLVLARKYVGIVRAPTNPQIDNFPECRYDTQ